MTQIEAGRRRRRRDDLGLVTFGFLLLLIGVIYVANPNISDDISAFFRPTNWKLTEVAPNVFLPAPTRNHPGLYLALEEFAFIFGIFHVVILAARFAIGSLLSQKASTVQGIVFWLCVGFLFDLLVTEAIMWWEFVTGAIVAIGLSLIAQGAAIALGRSTARERPHPYLRQLA